MNFKKELLVLSVLLMVVLAGCHHNATEMTNVEIVKNTYEGGSSEENGKYLEQYLAPDAKWTEAAGFPYGGTYTGFEEIRKNVFDRLASEWLNYKFEPEGYVGQGDKVVAYGTYSGTYKETGKHFKARVAHIWTLKEGKIVNFEQFVDSTPVRDAMTNE
ncbi:nuclear transport factor 2 family protein [Fulvivirga kasyanovii]|nr:nuclear transport factor 2 family protein [Fulvivirga kasyanovii]